MPSRLPAKDAEGKRAYPTPTAPSLLDTMWGRLDEITAELVREAEYDNDPHSMPRETTEWAALCRTKGEALGVAWCISVVESPYAPNVDAVRAEAMRRYNANQRG